MKHLAELYEQALKDYDQELTKRQELEKQCKRQKDAIDKAINNSQYWIDFYTKLNSDERIALRLQENIDILKEVSE